VAQNGISSLLKSRASFQARIVEHLKKIEEVERAGGYTSSLEREIRNFAQSINAIDELLKRGGYTFVQGELVKIIPPPT
jgi:hypothetical protein